MGQSFRVAIGAVLSIAAFAGSAYALNDPPSQAGRLAYTEGTVSFHDDQQAGWSPAVINTPLTSGDSIWTEPNARSEVSVAGTRVRMDGSTQLNLLAIEDNQTRLQVGQGRVDIRTFALNPNTPYQIVTPRGTVNLRQQGDYYVEAGSTQDATRLGVRAGAAQIQSLDGRTVTVNPGQVTEIFGDTGALQLRTLNTAPPVQPASWAARDRQINYDPPSQYVSAGITGYEDLNSYGSWSNDSQYGNVWAPRSVPAGWQPYKNGHWSHVKPWGWTWIDDQPWGYAPSHYGRWANSNNRWVWVPPQREAQPVYAPALVNFIGGIQLVQALLGGNTSAQASAPVGWFPLAPREAYVPSYSSDRAYYARLNSSNQVQAQALEDRWQRAQRREAYIAGQNSVLANQRFATVIPSDAFVRSQPVARAALQVPAAQIAAAPVAPVSAPPAPTASIAATAAPAAAPAAPAAADPKAATPAPAADPKVEADAKAKAKAEADAKTGANANLPVAKTAVADVPTLAPTTTAKTAAPGPKLATAPAAPAATTTPAPAVPSTATDNATAAPQAKVTAPPLVPRTGAAPPVLKDDKAPAAPPAAAPQAKAPAATDTKTPSVPAATPPAAPKPDTTAKPAEQPKAAAPAAPAAPPPPTPPQAKPEPAKPAEAPKTEAPKPDPPKAAAPPQTQPAPAAPRPTETRTPPPVDNKAPEKGAAATPPIPAPPAAVPPVAVPVVTPPVQVEPKVAVPQPSVTPAPIVQPAAKPTAVDKDDEPKKDEKK